MKALMKYPGSKWGSADWIISHFPEHHSYLEPFFGSGGVFFDKPRSDIETINDLDGEVVNLFRQIRNDPERLAREIYFTPYSREVYEMAYQKEPENDLEKAVLFYTRLNMGHGFRTQGEKVGWKLDIQGRERAYAAADWCKIPEKIMEAAERLRGVQIENRPAVEVIQKFNFENVLIYCDPPYVLSTRCRKQYRHENDGRGSRSITGSIAAAQRPGNYQRLFFTAIRRTPERLVPGRTDKLRTERAAAPRSYMVQPEDREDSTAVDTILKGKWQMKRKYGVVDYLRKHYPPPEGSGEVEVEFLEGYDSIEGPDGSMGFGVFVPTEEKIYIADDLPGGEESMIETVAHEWKHWLQYCNDEAYDEEEAEDFARQIVEEFL